MSKHVGAIDYDLMTLTRWTVDDVGGAMPWGRLSHFLSNLPQWSATRRELNGASARWLDGSKDAEILADIYDAISKMRYEFALAHTPKDKPKPEPIPPYPRPSSERKQEKRAPFDYEALRARLYGDERGE